MLWWTKRQLRSNNPNSRIRAIKKLRTYKDPEALDLLIAAIADKESEVENAAILELSYFKDPKVVKVLSDALAIADSQVSEAIEEGVRVTAGEGIGEFIDNDLQMKLAARWRFVAVRRVSSLIASLGKIDDPLAIQEIERVLARHPHDPEIVTVSGIVLSALETTKIIRDMIRDICR